MAARHEPLTRDELLHPYPSRKLLGTSTPSSINNNQFSVVVIIQCNAAQLIRKPALLARISCDFTLSKIKFLQIIGTSLQIVPPVRNGIWEQFLCRWSTLSRPPPQWGEIPGLTIPVHRINVRKVLL